MTTPAEGDSDFIRLLQRVLEGSERAVCELVGTYGPYLVRTIRRRLDPQMRGKFDSDDFTQVVWADFFAHRSTWADFRHPRQLIALLQRMGRNKVVDEHRRRMATRKYSLQRERPLQSLNGERQDWLRSSDPTPSQLAMARERWHSLLRGQPRLYREIFRLKLSGMTNRSVATRLGISEKTVQRVLQRLSPEPAE